MTAVLHPTDVLRTDRIMAAIDDNTINYSSPSIDRKAKYSDAADMLAEARAEAADWKAKYIEESDMLAETRAELNDFIHSSKELETELEQDIERNEKVQQDLRVKLARAEQERDDWKSKFMSLQTNHNSTTTSLQRELDTLRQDYQKVKIQLRELEMGNDDLERNERAISSSLADAEGKYSRVLEEKILLEHELFDKANVEEECQRLKDELRDANEEISVIKDQLTSALSRPAASIDVGSSTTSSVSSNPTPSASDDNLLHVSEPSGLRLSDLSLAPATPAKEFPSIGLARSESFGTPTTRHISSLQRPGFHSPRSLLSTPPSATPSSLMRSSTTPSFSTPSRLPPRTPAPRPLPSHNTSTPSAGAVPLTATRSKGVQMVSDLRSRVKVLEQKIHTRVPRLRMGSVTSRPGVNSMPPPSVPPPRAGPSTTSSPAPSTSSMHSSSRSTSHDGRERSHTLKSRRQSIESDDEHKRTPAADTSGWVLIMEDSPSPSKDKEKERRRLSSPSGPSAFRTIASTSESPLSSIPRAPSVLSQSTAPSGIRRPQSRLSVSTEGRSSVSTNATTSTSSSIPTPTSRPTTPTFLPIPSSGMYAGVGNGLKLSTGPGSGAYSQMKRSSLGASTNKSSPTRYSPPSHLPAPHANITMRQPSKLTAPSSLSQSRIGRPPGSSGNSGRRSTGEGTFNETLLDASSRGGDKSRMRSGSTAALYGRSARD